MANLPAKPIRKFFNGAILRFLKNANAEIVLGGSFDVEGG